jgi:hypothetical protein
MRTNPNQQLALETTLNTLIGQREFDRLCRGMRVHLDHDTLYVFVSNESCAAEIEASFLNDLAVAAEQVLSKPVRLVNVLPMDFTEHN